MCTLSVFLFPRCQATLGRLPACLPAAEVYYVPGRRTLGQAQLEELVSLCLDTRHTHAVDIDFTSETV